ncbi:MAG: alpha/beta hydrolase [Anaerolineae bacterium]|nr:alpha/beta hydrolase [Anaerolineae bacterium]
MAKEHQIRVSGQVMHALEFNPEAGGVPIIFLHGIMSSVYFWQSGADMLPLLNQRRWYALSLPGHFPAQMPADFPAAGLTGEMIAEVTGAAIGQLVGEEPALLVGHSTGGFAALAVAATQPERVQSVVSVAGFAQGYWTGILRPLQILAQGGRIGEALFRMQVRFSTLSAGIYYQMGGMYAADRGRYFAYPDLREAIRPLHAAAQQLDLKAMTHYFKRMPGIDIRQWLPRIQAPVLALAGTHDPIVSNEQSRMIAAMVPKGRLMMLEGGGHMLMVERSEAYARALEDWISEQDAAHSR